MVKSEILKDKDIVYLENNHLDIEDKDHQSALYLINILGSEYVIALGSARMEHSDKGVVYYPIYLMSPKNRIKAKIGVFELETVKTISVVDDDGDVDLNKLGDPLLFSYVTSEYLEKYGSHGTDLSLETPKDANMEDIENASEDEDADEDESGEEDEDKSDAKQDGENEDDEMELEDEDEMFSVQKPESKPDLEAQESKSQDPDLDKRLSVEDVFVKQDPLPTLPTWATESADDAKKMRDFYKKNKTEQDNWVVKFMNNKEYKIQNVAGDGDCFFATIRDAFAQMGYETTIPKLRKILSQEVTLELFENYKAIYDGLIFESNGAIEEMNRLQKINGDLKKQSNSTRNANQQKEILNEAVKVKQNYVTQKIQKGGADNLMEEFAFMKHVQSVEDLKTFVQTSEFWADSWAISTLELLLSIKIIILEDTDDIDSVIRCTQGNDTIEAYASYDPKYYILLAFNGVNHYDLISYKDKKIFKFPEVPYDIKVKVIRTCIENNDRSYYAQIPAFRQFRHELGVPEVSAASAEPEKEGEETSSELFDPSIVLSYHSGSDKKKKAGDVDADTVPYKRRNEFAVLHDFELWRRKLDDSWVEKPFTTIDGKRWNSVAHYLLAVPFKDSYPAVYADFSDESKSNIAKDLAKAKQSLEKKKDKVGQHYEVSKKITKMDESALEVFRKEALRAKFDKDTEMARLLKATNMAKLVRFRRNKEPLVDTSLMEVRAELNELQK